VRLRLSAKEQEISEMDGLYNRLVRGTVWGYTISKESSALEK
jgi:hypothetical protein